jgi:hypothetical protein
VANQRPQKSVPGAIIAVGIAPFFTGEERLRKTWLKLGYNLIVGTSELCKISRRDEVYLRTYCEDIAVEQGATAYQIF